MRRLGVTFHQGWADDVDFAAKTVKIETNADDSSVTSPSPTSMGVAAAASAAAAEQSPGVARGAMLTVSYDKLVIAVGAYSQTFGIPGVREHAHFLRDVSDARRIRLRVLSLFEQASSPALSDAQRAALLRFAVVGGGPTGIEFAAELHDLVHEDLARVYPELVGLVDITVYDVAPKVLPMFDRKLGEYATDLFRRQGIQVKTEHHLEGIRAGGDGGLMLKVKEAGDREVDVGLVVWSTGLMQNPLVKKLVEKEVRMPKGAAVLDQNETAMGDEPVHLVKDSRTGGIVTDPYLRARIEDASASQHALSEVLVIGDCAVTENDSTLPKTAQVASQQAAYLAKQLNRGILGAQRPFRFRNWGTMAYLGNWKAIHQSSADELKGWTAWLLWRTAYLTYSMSVRNKIMVLVYWMISWLFGRDISRF